MKRCPKCRRDYHDDSLIYCLDDGAALLDGPGYTSESETAILSEPQTLPFVDETEPSPTRPGLNRRFVAVPLVIAFIVAGAFLGYRYFYPSSKQIGSIAVIPFVNESRDPEVEHLSDGMSETLINSLSRLPNLSVKARSSVFRYKGRETDAQTIGKELNVQAVLTGRLVSRAGDLVVLLELVDSETGDRIWGEQYVKPLSNIISLQNEIARDVSKELKAKLTGVEAQRLAENYTDNPEAYQLYLRGRFHWNKRNDKDLHRAIEYFREAIAVDPGYALAFAGLADSYALLPFFGPTAPQDAMPKARDAATKAIEIDDELAEARASLGLIKDNFDYDFTGAESEFKRALELNPNYVTAMQWYSELLTHIGRHDEALTQIQRALELDPLSLAVNKGYADALYFARRYDPAAEQLRRTLELDAGFATPYRVLGYVYEMKGDHARSIEEFARFQEVSGRTDAAAKIRQAFADDGWTGFLRTTLGLADEHRLPMYMRARLWTGLGEKDRAFAELNRAYDRREFFIVLLKVDPSMDPLRDDPRFHELMRRVGFP